MGGGEACGVVSLLVTLSWLSATETGVGGLAPTGVSMVEAVAEAVSLYEMVAEDRGIRVRNEVPAGTVMFADPQRLRQALVILLDNALQ